MRFFRKKVKYNEFIEGLCIIAINIRNDLLNYLDDILKSDYLFNKEISWQDEIIRREWELMFFINSLITLKLETFKNKYPSIDIDFINYQAEIYGKIYNKIDFIDKFNNKMEVYRHSLIDGVNFMSNCFLSLLWLNIADPKGLWIPHALSEQLKICEVSVKIIEDIYKVYNNFRII